MNDSFETAVMPHETPESPPLALSLSLARKVNLGNYQSADVFVSVSGVTQGTTQEEIDALLAGPGALAFNSVRAGLNAQIQVVRSTMG